MDPMLDPDLIEFMDDESLLAAFEMVRTAPNDSDHCAVLAELGRRDLHPVATPTLAVIADKARADRLSIPLRL